MGLQFYSGLVSRWQS